MNLFGTETSKALTNFGSAGQGSMHRIPDELIRAYAEVKLAALEGLQETEGYFSDEVMESLRRSATAVIRGDVASEFPLPMAQGGAGTSFHMNLNEVLTSMVAGETGSDLDPIVDLARYQSTNDTFASAAVILAFRLVEDAEVSVVELQNKLVALELEYDSYLMCGRTEMQDALPMRVGSLYAAWAGSVERDRWRLSKVAERVREIPLGGTALGNGFGAPRAYSHSAERHLRRITGLPLSRSQNMADGVALKDNLAEVAGTMRLGALNISRIVSDLLYYSSAPVSEFSVPNLQYGSSMMPLKTNPVLLERCRGLALSAMIEADKVDLYAREGQMQLNAYLPFLLRALHSCAVEYRTAISDLGRILDTSKPELTRMEANLARSPALLNALLPLLGYRNLKNLETTISARMPESLSDLAVIVAAECSLDIQTVDGALEPSQLTGPPKDQL